MTRKRPETVRDSIAHLHSRVVVQKHHKTNRNRLRWTLQDIAAVETLLRAIDNATRRRNGND